MRQNYRTALTAAIISAGLVTPAVAQLNENCTVSVLNRNVQVNPGGAWAISNVPVNQGRVRARATCIFSGITKFGQSDLFTVPLNLYTEVRKT